MITRYRIFIFLALAGAVWIAAQAFMIPPVVQKTNGSTEIIVKQVDDANYYDGNGQEVTFYSKQSALSNDKIPRKGFLIKRPNAQATVLICHGFMCDKHDVGFLRTLFPNCNTMTFDFRAHGECKENQCCTLGRDEAYDVIAAAQFLKSQLKVPLIAFGFSMGAAAAIEGQAQDKGLFDAMILDCPFDSSENIIKRGLENLKFTLFGREFEVPGRSLLQKYAFHPYVQSLVKAVLKTVAKMDSRDINMFVQPIAPAESIKKVSVPCFFIHCKQDQRVSTGAVKAIYDGAGSSYKMLWLTNGRWHFDSYFYNPEKYTSLVKSFVEKISNGKIDQLERQKIMEDSPDNSMNARG